MTSHFQGENPTLPNSIGLPDEFYLHIGHMTTNWAVIEQQCDFILRSMAIHPANKDLPEREHEKQQFARRVKRLRKLSGWLEDDLKKKLKTALDDVLKLHKERNLYVHGSWVFTGPTEAESVWVVTSLGFDTVIDVKVQKPVIVNDLKNVVMESYRLYNKIGELHVRILMAMPPALRGTLA